MWINVTTLWNFEKTNIWQCSTRWWKHQELASVYIKFHRWYSTISYRSLFLFTSRIIILRPLIIARWFLFLNQKYLWTLLKCLSTECSHCESTFSFYRLVANFFCCCKYLIDLSRVIITRKFLETGHFR